MRCHGPCHCEDGRNPPGPSFHLAEVHLPSLDSCACRFQGQANHSPHGATGGAGAVGSAQKSHNATAESGPVSFKARHRLFPLQPALPDLPDVKAAVDQDPFQSRRGKSAGDIRSASPPRTCIVTAAYDVLTVDASPVESRVAAMEARHREWLDHAPSLAKAHHVRLRDYCVCSGG
jgi:hypothetical protein